METVYKTKNYAMLVDFYELTMTNGYLKHGYKDQVVVFDVFFRKIPDGGGYVISTGLNEVVDYIMNLSFTNEDIDYLKTLNIFDQEFFDFLLNFKFKGDLIAVKEGTIVYPNEPVMTIIAPILEAQLIETMILLITNHQSLICTKANRIVNAAMGRDVIELGARRAQGFDAAIYGAKAAYLGGVKGTATLLAGQLFDIPVYGTMAHSWVQFFDSEYEAFEAYAKTYPDSCVLLVDTYNTLKSGIINAIKIHNEVLKPNGNYLKGVRIDSGDLAFLSKKARKLLDEAGLYDTKIIVSNSVDETLILSLIDQDAKIDTYGVGERLITAKSDPVFGGVYKLVAVKKEESFIPKIKISDNSEKVVNPGLKKLYRVYDHNGLSFYDILALDNEVLDEKTILKNPDKLHKEYHISNNHTLECLHHTIIKDGKLVYELPSINEIKSYINDNLSKLQVEEKRIQYAHTHPLDMTINLLDLKYKLLNKYE